VAQHAHAERFGLRDLAPAPEHEPGRARAQVEHQAPLAAVAQGAGHAQVDQPPLLGRADHLDRMAERLPGGRQEGSGVARRPQGRGGDGAHRARAVPGQHRAEIAQAGERGAHRNRRQAAVGVEMRSQADRLGRALAQAQPGRAGLAYIQAKTVGPQFDRGVGGGLVVGIGHDGSMSCREPHDSGPV
jgi:hypothetical protein